MAWWIWLIIGAVGGLGGVILFTRGRSTKSDSVAREEAIKTIQAQLEVTKQERDNLEKIHNETRNKLDDVRVWYSEAKKKVRKDQADEKTKLSIDDVALDDKLDSLLSDDNNE